MQGPRVVRLGPGDMGWTKQRNYGAIKSRSEMTRPAVCRHQQVGPANASLGQSEPQVWAVGRRCHRPVRQSVDGWVIGLGRDLLGLLLLSRSTQDKDAAPPAHGQIAGQRGKVLGGPVLGRAERSSRI